MLVVKLGMALPCTSYPTICNELEASSTGTRMVQPEIEFQVRGYSTPLILMVLIWTGGEAVSVSKLLVVVITFVPEMAKAALPPAPLIWLMAKLAREDKKLPTALKSWPGRNFW